MKWILLLAIIPIIQYGEVAGYPPILKYLENDNPIEYPSAHTLLKYLKNQNPIENTPADRNKLKSPESNCDYCHLNDIIRAAYEASRKEEQQTGHMFGYPESSFDEPFEDIFQSRSARSPRVELPDLTNSFDHNLDWIKIRLNSLERKYELVDEFLQKAEANEEEEDWFPWTAKSILSYWPRIFDDDIDDIMYKLGLLKINYERVIDNLKELEATRNKEQRTGHMFEHRGSLFDETFKDIIQSRSTRSTYLTNSFNDALDRIRITLNILERNYKYINELLKKAKANEEEGQQTDQISLIEESSKYIPYFGWIPSTELSILITPWTRMFDSDMVYIEDELGWLRTNYEHAIDNLKKIEDSKKANSQEDKKDPSPSESIVSNNNTQENVTQTIPTPDKSTNTQKPVPAKHDDKKDKLVGEKDPLHIPEIAPNNKTPENVMIIPVESTTIDKLESTTIKNEEKSEQVEQEAKKDRFVSFVASIKNDPNPRFPIWRIGRIE